MSGKTTKVVLSFSLLCAVLAVLLVFSSAQRTHTQENAASCILSAGQCDFFIGQELATITINPQPQIEEPLTVEINGKYVSSIQSIHIEGVNMYMGKIPVVNEQSAERLWQGWTMLGACSEPAMKWHLVVSFKDTTQVQVIEFTTQS